MPGFAASSRTDMGGCCENGSGNADQGGRAAASVGPRVFHLAKKAWPALISIGLVSWLVWKITPAKLAEAAATTALPWLILATLVQLVVLFLWDTYSLWWLFSQPNQPIPFRVLLPARTDSIFWSAINLEIGQGMFAWTLAEIQKRSVSDAVARCLVLGAFDFGTLQNIDLSARCCTAIRLSMFFAGFLSSGVSA